MNLLLKEIRHSPLLWMLAFVPAVLLWETIAPSAHTTLFVLAVLAIVPLAALLSHATEAVAERTGDAIGGLLNATLGNLTELIIAVTALHAGEYMLVKASIAGAIVTNSLFMLGASFLLGGLRYHVQHYNRAGGRLYSALLLMATIALLAPAAIADLDLARGDGMAQKLSVGLALLLMAAYFSAARKNRLDMSVSIALGSASQIALFVAPVLVLLSYVIGPAPMDLQFWPGAVKMVMIAAVTATFITNSGRSAWFVGALLVFIYVIFAMTLYMVPPGSHGPV
jgi:Ca2+/H+ antiporter